MRRPTTRSLRTNSTGTDRSRVRATVYVLIGILLEHDFLSAHIVLAVPYNSSRNMYGVMDAAGVAIWWAFWLEVAAIMIRLALSLFFP